MRRPMTPVDSISTASDGIPMASATAIADATQSCTPVEDSGAAARRAMQFPGSLFCHTMDISQAQNTVWVLCPDPDKALCPYSRRAHPCPRPRHSTRVVVLIRRYVSQVGCTKGHEGRLDRVSHGVSHRSLQEAHRGGRKGGVNRILDALTS